jgi:hypothetical protein
MNAKKIPQPKYFIVHVIQAVTGKTREKRMIQRNYYGLISNTIEPWEH